MAAIDRKIENIHRAVEDRLNDAICANSRLKELIAKCESLVSASWVGGGPPQIYVKTVMKYRKDAQKLLQHGKMAERKQFLKTLVQEIECGSFRFALISEYELQRQLR